MKRQISSQTEHRWHQNISISNTDIVADRCIHTINKLLKIFEISLVPFCVPLVRSGYFWSVLGTFGPFWLLLGTSGAFWLLLVCSVKYVSSFQSVLCSSE